MNKNHYLYNPRILTQNRMYNQLSTYLGSRNNVLNINKSPEDGLISFEVSGFQFLFVYEEKDPNYIRLLLPNIEQASTLGNSIHKTICNANTLFKGVKVLIIDGAIWLGIEQFVYSTDNIDLLFSRLISVLIFAINNIAKYLNESNNGKE